jgi:translation initiation factor IF-3
MFFSVKETGRSGRAKRRQALEHLQEMEGQMKIAQEEIKARKEEQERKLQAGTRVYVKLVLWSYHSHIQRCVNSGCQVSPDDKILYGSL